MDVTHARVHPSLTEIPACSFKGRGQLQHVDLHEGLLKIGAKAFYGCHQLEIVDLPEGLQEIGECALAGCRSLPLVKNLPPLKPSATQLSLTHNYQLLIFLMD